MTLDSIRNSCDVFYEKRKDLSCSKASSPKESLGPNNPIWKEVFMMIKVMMMVMMMVMIKVMVMVMMMMEVMTTMIAKRSSQLGQPGVW